MDRHMETMLHNLREMILHSLTGYLSTNTTLIIVGHSNMDQRVETELHNLRSNVLAAVQQHEPQVATGDDTTCSRVETVLHN